MAHLGPSLRREKRKERPLRRAGGRRARFARGEPAPAVGARRRGGVPPRRRAGGSGARHAHAALLRAVGREPRGRQGSPRRSAAARTTRAPPGRVVELPPEQKASERPPAEAKFLSDRNTKVERETVSRHAGNYPRVAPRPEAGGAGKAPPEAGAAARDVPRGGTDAGAPGREGAPGDRVAMARPRGESAAAGAGRGRRARPSRPGWPRSVGLAGGARAHRRRPVVRRPARGAPRGRGDVAAGARVQVRDLHEPDEERDRAAVVPARRATPSGSGTPTARSSSTGSGPSCSASPSTPPAT